MSTREGRRRYREDDYVTPGRIHSFAHQLAQIIEVRPDRVLEVGVGSGYVQDSLRNVGVDVTTVDIQPGLGADLTGSVTALPAETDAFDVVSCCQVLEHLAFDEVPTALGELGRVARRRVVISVPDVSRSVDLAIRAPLLGFRRVNIALPYRVEPMSQDRDVMTHRWEIGFRGFPQRRIRQAIADAGLDIEATWRVPELGWHRFFALMPRGASR